MKNLFWMSLAAVVSFGCQQSAPTETTLNSSEAPVVAKESGNATMTSNPTPSPSGTTNKVEQTGGEQSGDAGGNKITRNDNPPVGNPYRIYQLKDLKRYTTKINGHEIKIWVMDTNDKRMEGMMFLEDNEVAINEGMLFVFASSAPRNFWMKNTYIPLDIAYMSPSKTVLNTLRMEALDVTTPYPSKGNAKYAFEMKAGAFEKYGIKAGTVIEVPAEIKATD